MESAPLIIGQESMAIATISGINVVRTNKIPAAIIDNELSS